MSNFAIVVGGPGTGKTTYLGKLVEWHTRPDRTILVSAPYGGIPGQYVGHIRNLYRTRKIPPVALVEGERDQILRFALKLGSCTVVVDEAGSWFKGNKPWSPESPAYKVMHEGRHHRVFLLTATQFPYDLHPEVRAADSWTFFLRITSARDLGWVLERTGSREAKERVRTLQGRRPLLWLPAGRGLCWAPDPD